MPRKWTEMITDFPVLRPDRAYRSRIFDVERTDTGLRVELEQVDVEHAGRRHELKLDRPFKPCALLSQLFHAAGIDASPRRRVAPLELRGRTVVVFFGRSADGSVVEVVRVEPDTAVLPTKPAILPVAAAGGNPASLEGRS